MRSKWKVTSNVINGENMYAVYRMIDKNEPDHSGNREYHGEYRYSKELAQREADRLNEEAEEP